MPNSLFLAARIFPVILGPRPTLSRKTRQNWTKIEEKLKRDMRELTPLNNFDFNPVILNYELYLEPFDHYIGLVIMKVGWKWKSVGIFLYCDLVFMVFWPRPWLLCPWPCTTHSNKYKLLIILQGHLEAIHTTGQAEECPHCHMILANHCLYLKHITMFHAKKKCNFCSKGMHIIRFHLMVANSCRGSLFRVLIFWVKPIWILHFFAPIIPL